MSAAKQTLRFIAVAALLGATAACAPDAPPPEESAEEMPTDAEQMPIDAGEPASAEQPAEAEQPSDAEQTSANPVPTVEPQAKAREAGQVFLAENGARENVVTTDSGLQYEVLVTGAGATPGPLDKVTAHYHGTLIDGSVFDSSVERGEPFAFTVNGVIKGWQEALQLMTVGDKWKLYIPPNLAYGDRGTGPIGPNETLIFEVELLDVERRG